MDYICDYICVCCRPPDQEEQIDEMFFEELEVASHSQAVVLVGGPQAP